MDTCIDSCSMAVLLSDILPCCQVVRTGIDIEDTKSMYTMKDTQIRAALDEHWAASAAGDLEKEHDIYDDDVVVDYPQSGERIISRHNIQALRGHHPSKPAGFTIRRIIGNGD